MAHPAMDFTNVGGVEVKGASYRAHVVWKDSGVNRNIRGPAWPNEETALQDLQNMRSAARGMGRENGFAALQAALRCARYVPFLCFFP